jgi:hypothetical protein
MATYGQTLLTLSALPTVIHESSGIEAIHSNLFLTHNDGGNDPLLFFIDSNSRVVRQVYVKDVDNTDWEDITIAPDGHVYIGNFGNNGHNRRNLEVLVLPKLNDWITDTITAQVIRFSYKDQTAFPPMSNNQVFDCEAMAYFEDSLYLFNKNWSSPFTGMVKMYVLPTKPGQYDLLPRDSVNLGVFKEISWVTGADIADSSLYLIGSASIWKLSFSDKPSLKNPIQINLNHFSQKEAISVLEENLYITDESTGGFGNLYRYSMVPVSGLQDVFRDDKIDVWQDGGTVVIQNPKTSDIIANIYSLDGGLVLTINSRASTIKISEKMKQDGILSSGIYVLNIMTESGRHFSQKIMTIE